jgi:hypothetical protein
MVKWTGVVVLVTFALLGRIEAQDRGAVDALSALDYYEIKQLHSRFAHGLDTGVDGGRLLASAFIEDGEFVDESGRVTRGHDALAELARANPNAGPTNVGHYVTNVAIHMVPGGAVGRSDVMIGRREAGAPRGTFFNGGQYTDTYVRTAAGWRIKSRTFRRAGSALEALPVRVSGSEGSVQARQGSLTASDYAEIEMLYARYSHAFDSASNRGWDWAQLFALDGSHRNFPNQYIKGHEVLAEFAYDERGNQAGTKTPLSALHFITNVMIESVPEGVIAKAHLMYVRRAGDGQPTAIYPGGTYWDLIVRTPEGWRYREKNVIMANLPVPPSAQRLMQLTERATRQSDQR